MGEEPRHGVSLCWMPRAQGPDGRPTGLAREHMQEMISGETEAVRALDWAYPSTIVAVRLDWQGILWPWVLPPWGLGEDPPLALDRRRDSLREMGQLPE